MKENAKERVHEIAAPIRELLQKLIRKKIKTRDERQALADYLGIQLSSLSNMLYKGEGGLNLWLATLVYCYNLDLEQMAFFFENINQINGKVDALSPSDRAWFQLGSTLSDEDKDFAAKLIEGSMDLHREMYEKKKERLNKK